MAVVNAQPGAADVLIMRVVMVALLVLVLSGCTGAAVAVPQGQGPGSGLAAEEVAFLAEVRASGFATPTDTDEGMLRSGRQICGSVLPREQVIRNAVAMGYEAGRVDAAFEVMVRHLCPSKVWAVPGPVTSFTDGTHLVGSEIVPGRYRTAGASARAVPNCYWARLSGTSGTSADVIANGNGTGPVTITIAVSDVAFRTSGCAGWTKTG